MDTPFAPPNAHDLLIIASSMQVLNEDMAGDEVQRSVRQCLLSFFSAFDSETLPPPSIDPYVMRNIDNPLYQKDICPPFLQKVEYVRKRILDNCSAKRGFTRGSVVSGFRKSLHCKHLTLYTPSSARMSPENTHKLMGLHMEILILGIIL